MLTEVILYTKWNAIVWARVKLRFVFQATPHFFDQQEGRRRVQPRKDLHIEDDRIVAAIFVVFEILWDKSKVFQQVSFLSKV